MDSSSPDLSDYLDLDFVIAAPPETEDAPPVAANFVNVHGDGDAFALDFFYVHPAKVDRLFAEHTGARGGAVPRPGETDVVRHEAEPVARITIPLSTATELVTELVERIGEGVPHLRDVLEAFGAKLHALSHTAEHGLDGHHEHEHEDGDDHDHDDDAS